MVRSRAQLDDNSSTAPQDIHVTDTYHPGDLIPTLRRLHCMYTIPSENSLSV